MKTILIVEDNKLNLELLLAILGRNGYKVLSADSGTVGVESASSCYPDLILMDIQMPEIDGYMALTILRQQESTRQIPVVAVTGNAMSNDIKKIWDAGFNDIITKPFRIDELLSVVRKLIPVE